jgi:hypothetical protein
MNKNHTFDNPLGLSEKIINTILDHQSNEEMKKMCSVIRLTDNEVEDFQSHVDMFHSVLFDLQQIVFPSLRHSSSTEEKDQEELEELEELARTVWLYMKKFEDKICDAWEIKEKGKED